MQKEEKKTKASSANNIILSLFKKKKIEIYFWAIYVRLAQGICDRIEARC